MKTIEQKVKDIVKDGIESKRDNQNVKNFEKANNEFKTLVEKGITEHRGNNLLSVEDTHLNRNTFNVASTQGRLNA